MLLHRDTKKFTSQIIDLIENCRASANTRVAQCRQIRQWLDTGSDAEKPAIYNKLATHVDRLASYLFSPVDLRFTIDFENHYPEVVLKQAAMAARTLTRQWDRRDIDMLFAAGVQSSLEYGCAIPKLMWDDSGLAASLVMPWQFSVYREDRNGLGAQEMVCESTWITQHDLWRRISHLPGAIDLYKRAKAHARKLSATEEDTSFFHQVVLAGTSPYLTVETGSVSPSEPGGLVGMDPRYMTGGPQVATPLIQMHEAYIIDDEMGDYTTVQ
ncbi:hypothetical protein KGP36_06935, partial [Patescibacteria group bacterium]|nr:hypothetical protein [Patescibacteria group bacterium]